MPEQDFTFSNALEKDDEISIRTVIEGENKQETKKNGRITDIKNGYIYYIAPNGYSGGIATGWTNGALKVVDYGTGEHVKIIYEDKYSGGKKKTHRKRSHRRKSIRRNAKK